MLAVREGDRNAAFNELVQRLTPALTRVAHHMVQPAYTDDLVQETWIRAWKYRHTYRGDAQPFTWLHSIMAHAAAKDPALRATANDHASTDELACLKSPAEMDGVLKADAIDRALAQLDHLQAMIIRRRHLAEQDWATITSEMHFTSIYHAQKIYEQAIHKLSARHTLKSSRPEKRGTRAR